MLKYAAFNEVLVVDTGASFDQLKCNQTAMYK